MTGENMRHYKGIRKVWYWGKTEKWGKEIGWRRERSCLEIVKKKLVWSSIGEKHDVYDMKQSMEWHEMGKYMMRYWYNIEESIEKNGKKRWSAEEKKQKQYRIRSGMKKYGKRKKVNRKKYRLKSRIKNT